jgi:hypothetical protein
VVPHVYIEPVTGQQPLGEVGIVAFVGLEGRWIGVEAKANRDEHRC